MIGALAVDESGIVVGYSQAADGRMYPVRRDRPDRVVQLPVPPEISNAAASAINSRGDVIGWLTIVRGIPTALRWDRSGRLTVLQPLTASGAAAVAINNEGIAIGWSQTDIGGQAVRCVGTSAAMYSSYDRPWCPLPRDQQFRGCHQRQGQCRVDAMNDRDVIIDMATSADDHNHGVFWNPDGRVHILPTLSDQGPTEAGGLNDHGLIVGHSTAADGTRHAIVWRIRT